MRRTLLSFIPDCIKTKTDEDTVTDKTQPSSRSIEEKDEPPSPVVLPFKTPQQDTAAPKTTVTSISKPTPIPANSKTTVTYPSKQTPVPVITPTTVPCTSKPASVAEPSKTTVPCPSQSVLLPVTSKLTVPCPPNPISVSIIPKTTVIYTSKSKSVPKSPKPTVICTPKSQSGSSNQNPKKATVIPRNALPKVVCPMEVSTSPKSSSGKDNDSQYFSPLLTEDPNTFGPAKLMDYELSTKSFLAACLSDSSENVNTSNPSKDKKEKEVTPVVVVEKQKKRFKGHRSGPVAANCNTWVPAQLVLITGSAHPSLAEKIADCLSIRLTEVRVCGTKENAEIEVEIGESVRGKHAVIVQSASFEVNVHLMEMLQLIYTCKTFAAASITIVCPYLPYSRQCRRVGRANVPMKLIADMIVKAGAKRVLSTDLFRKEIQGFFPIPVENLRSSAYILEFIRQNINRKYKWVVVARGADVMQRAVSYAERLNCKIATIHGDSRCGTESSESRAESPAPEPDEKKKREKYKFYKLYKGLPAMPSKKKSPLHLIGKVSGRIALLIDNVIENPEQISASAMVLKGRGAKEVHVVAIHGCFSPNSHDNWDDPNIDSIIVTNSCNHSGMGPVGRKVTTVDISPLLAEAIRRVHNNESISPLYTDAFPAKI